MGNVSTVRARIMIISSAWLVAACTPQLTEVSIPRPATTVPAATTTISMVDIPVPSESTLPEAPDHRDPNLDPPGTMVVTPSDDLVSIVANAPDGSTIRFSEGLYRGVMIEVRAGMTFLGDEGAVLRGSVLIEGFVPEGDGWAAPAPVQPATEPEQGPEWGWCDDDRPACVFPEQVFMDDTTLLRVTSAAELGPGRWYLDGTRVVVGDDPAGRDVEISSLPYAFWGDADGITVDGLVMERYATPGRQGVVNPRIGRIGPAGLGWVVTNNVLRDSHGWGVKLETGMVVAGNVIERNGQGGIGGVARDVTIERNIIRFNCTAGFRCFGWEGGGMKLETDNVVIRDNVVEGNLGHGIHTDRGSDDVLIEGNLVRANLGAGIHHEISGAAMIADNTVVGNGFAPGRPPEPGILVLGSSSTTVASNMVEANALGIVIRQDERVDEGVLRSVAVSDNTVISAGGPVAVVGGSTGVDDDRAWLAEVQFSANSYVLTSGDMFRWDGLPVDAGGWQAAGQDSEGRFSGG